jgi:hypothetical protein
MTVAWDPIKTNAPDSFTQLTSVGNSWSYFTQEFTLDPNQYAVIQITVDNDNDPTETDHAIVGLFHTHDLTSENWDDDEFDAWYLNNDTNPRSFTFVVRGLFKFRVGVMSTGSTDTYTADGKYRVATES